jgi:hypothetical protein
MRNKSINTRIWRHSSLRPPNKQGPSAVGLGILLLGAMLSLSAADGAKPEKLPLSLVDANKPSATFSWAQLIGGNAIIPVWNGTKDSLQVSAHLSPLQRDPVGDTPSAVNLAISVSPSSIDVPEYGVRRFLLTASISTPPLPGSYTGFLFVLDAKGKSEPFSQQIRLLVPGPQPLLAKLSVIVWRLGPWIPWQSCREFDVPLKDRTSTNVQSGLLLGAVRDDAGDRAAVRWKNQQPTTGGPTLVVDYPPSAGKYDGDLTWGEGSDKATMSLNVVVKDLPILPIATIVVGTLLALQVKRYLGVFRVTWGLREREAQLGDAFQKSQTAFVRAAEGQPFGGYSIAQTVAEGRRTVLTLISKLESGWATSVGDKNQDYQSALSKLQALSSAISAWGGFGDKLQVLFEALTTVQQSSTGNQWEPGVPKVGPPAFYDPARQLLIGGQVATLDDFATLRQKVDEQTAIASLWPQVRKQVSDYTADFRSLAERADLSEDQKAQIKAFRAQLVTLWTNLWAVDGHSTQLDSVVNTDLPRVRDGVAQLKDSIAPGPQTALPITNVVLATASAAPISVLSWFRTTADLDLPANDQRRAEMLEQAITRGDVQATVFAGAIALLTGLNTYYLGKPFGTLQDYIGLFLWAAGTKVALDILTAVWDKFVSVPLG